MILSGSAINDLRRMGSSYAVRLAIIFAVLQCGVSGCYYESKLAHVAA
jgi:hypothetical protein